MNDKFFDFMDAHGMKIRWFAWGWFASAVFDVVLEVVS